MRRILLVLVFLVFTPYLTLGTEGFPEVPVDPEVVVGSGAACDSGAACSEWAHQQCVGPALELSTWQWTVTDCYVVCMTPCPPTAPWYCSVTRQYIWFKADC